MGGAFLGRELPHEQVHDDGVLIGLYCIGAAGAAPLVVPHWQRRVITWCSVTSHPDRRDVRDLSDPRQSLRDDAASALASDSVDKALLEPLDIPLEPICLISKIFSRVL